MPEMDGYELTAAIRAAEQGSRHIPIVALTANALKGEEEHCLAIGMDDYLSKPTQLADLKATLEKWMPVADESTSHPPLQGEGGGGDGLNPNNPLGSHSPIPPPTPPEPTPILTFPLKGKGQSLSLPQAGESWREGMKGGERVEQRESQISTPSLTLPLQGGGNIAVDVNVLKKLVGDDEATIREFLHDFRISAAKTADELRTACVAGQTAAAGALAHKLKSSARSVGALALGELCAEMEQAGKAGDMKALTVLLPRFEQELAGVEGFLEGY